MSNAKPIVVIYFPDAYMGGSMDRHWIYDYMNALNGETDNQSKWSLKKDYTDYHWFCFYKDDIREPEFRVFYEKDFTKIQYEELKKMVHDALQQSQNQSIQP